MSSKTECGKSNDRIILGIDPVTGRCGWAIIRIKNKELRIKNEDGVELAECGLIETPAKTPLSDRLEIIFEKITELIKKYHPTEMAIEELFFVKNVKTGISVAHARGVIMLAGKLAKIPVFEYKPNEIKLAIAGHGHADKEQMLKMLKMQIKLPTVQDDAVDAVAIGLCHLQRNRIFYHANQANKSRISREENSEIVYRDLSYKVVGVLYRVSNLSGYISNERYYYPLIEKEFKKEGLEFKKQLPVTLRISPLKRRYFIDYIIEDKIILEIKVGSRIAKTDVDQAMGYLRETRKRLAILARFTRAGVTTKRFLYKDNSREISVKLA